MRPGDRRGGGVGSDSAGRGPGSSGEVGESTAATPRSGPSPRPGGSDRCAPPGEEAEIRRAEFSDLRDVLRIERTSFALPWSESAFRALMGRPEAVVLVAEAEAGVVGYAAVWLAADEAELGDLAVDPAVRRRGVGRALLDAALREARGRGARTLFLQVRESNDAARRLYEGAGFRRVGRRARYYRSPVEDGLILARETRRV